MSPAVGGFLNRLVRLDPAALVRVRAGALWALVPWNVIVTRPVSGLDSDRTVSARAWLELDADDPSSLPRLDAQWRLGMPTAAPVVVETLPMAVLRQVSAAAGETLREASVAGLNGRAVGERVLRDALLDHVPIVISPGMMNMNEIRVPQRVVQAVARMGFLGSDSEYAHVVTSGAWVGVTTEAGDAWWRAPSALLLNAHRA